MHFYARWQPPDPLILEVAIMQHFLQTFDAPCRLFWEERARQEGVNELLFDPVHWRLRVCRWGRLSHAILPA